MFMKIFSHRRAEFGSKASAVRADARLTTPQYFNSIISHWTKVQYPEPLTLH